MNIKMLISPKTKAMLVMLYALASVLMMLMGVMFCFSSSLWINENALGSTQPNDLVLFHQANFYVGISFFVFGVFMASMPIIVSWYERQVKKFENQCQDSITHLADKNGNEVGNG